MRLQALCLLGLGFLLAPAVAARELPAVFAGDLVSLIAEADDGRTLRLYTDTGGGTFVKQAAVERLGLPSQVPANPAIRRELGDGALIARLPDFALSAGIPEPRTDGGVLPVMPAAAARHGLPGAVEDDGMLGQIWFADRTWTWDYAARSFRLEPDGWRPPEEMRRVALGFRTGQDGERETHFPRMEAVVDGKTISLLLDSGAMTVLTPGAIAELDDGLPPQRATSMIVDSVFQAWRRDHPDWRVIEDAQAGTGSAMIEVPEVEIAGWRVGPVWFTHRPDPNFHEFMSGMMDARVDGALGGNAFRHFTMTVDYRDSAAWFRCAGECAADD